MGVIAAELSGSSDFMIKMDTDEFLAAFDEESGALSPDALRRMVSSEFVGNKGHPLAQNIGKHRIIQLRQDSYPSEHICNQTACQSMGYECDATLFPLGKMWEEHWFKCLFDSSIVNITGGINLGGHAIGECSHQKGATPVPIGVLHYHRRCFDIEAFNNKKTCMSHGFLSESDLQDVGETIKKLTGVLRMRNVCGERMKCRVVSCQKVYGFAKYLQCPEKYRKEFYAKPSVASSSLPGLSEQGHHIELHNRIKLLEKKIWK
jgi:hypothetical protein